MSRYMDITGRTYNYLTVIKKDDSRKDRIHWICKCKCGNTVSVCANAIRNGKTKSCGCKKFETHNATHSMSKTPIYSVWSTIIQRCYNEKNKYFNRYGKRGIAICDEWRHSFESFHQWSIEHGYKRGLTIDRIDVNGNYQPNNCRWVDHHTQQMNRTNTIFIEIDGETVKLYDYCKSISFDYRLAVGRYERVMKKGGKPTAEYLFAPRSSNAKSTAKRKVGRYSSDGKLVSTYDAISYVVNDGFSKSNVSNCLSGLSKTAHGYIWKYLD